MERFYFVADWGSRHYLHTDNIMVSASGMWFPKRQKFGKWVIPDGVQRVFVDSGGFAFFRKWGEYPFDIPTYLEFVYELIDRYPVTEVAILDYPCEPEVARSHHRTNLDRIEATVSNAVACIDYDKKLPWVPVIQGFSLEEYLHCWSLYQETGIEAQLWAIGSLCARKKLGGANRIVTRLAQVTEKPIHAFGLSLDIVRDTAVWFSLTSSDSAAWNWGISDPEDKPLAVSEYNLKIGKIFRSFEGQQFLEAG